MGEGIFVDLIIVKHISELEKNDIKKIKLLLHALLNPLKKF